MAAPSNKTVAEKENAPICSIIQIKAASYVALDSPYGIVVKCGPRNADKDEQCRRYVSDRSIHHSLTNPLFRCLSNCKQPPLTVDSAPYTRDTDLSTVTFNAYLPELS